MAEKAQAHHTRRLRPAVFLDRDGTIIEDRGHLRDASDVVLLPGAAEALRRLGGRFLLFIVTNQPGIAEGVLTQADVARVNAHLLARLSEAGVRIQDVYVCPHRRLDGCSCIKPHPHFLREAAEQHGIDLAASYVVGDHPHDVELARRAGARGICVLTGHGAKHRGELPPETHVVADICEAVQSILSQGSPS